MFTRTVGGGTAPFWCKGCCVTCEDGERLVIPGRDDSTFMFTGARNHALEQTVLCRGSLQKRINRPAHALPGNKLQAFICRRRHIGKKRKKKHLVLKVQVFNTL